MKKIQVEINNAWRDVATCLSRTDDNLLSYDIKSVRLVEQTDIEREKITMKILQVKIKGEWKDSLLTNGISMIVAQTAQDVRLVDNNELVCTCDNCTSNRLVYNNPPKTCEHLLISHRDVSAMIKKEYDKQEMCNHEGDRTIFNPQFCNKCEAEFIYDIFTRATTPENKQQKYNKAMKTLNDLGYGKDSKSKLADKLNIKIEDIYSIVQCFGMFEETIKKRDTMIFTTEEGKWYERVRRTINDIANKL